MSFLDSSFVPFPTANDALLIYLSSQKPHQAWLYAALATAGSLAGAYVLYGLARGGKRLIKVPAKKIERAERWLRGNAFASMLVIALLPPPAPFKVFLLAAGFLQVNALSFGLGLLVGRGLRFAIEAWFGAVYGTEAEAYLKANLHWISLSLAALVLLLILARRVLRRPGAVREDGA